VQKLIAQIKTCLGETSTCCSKSITSTSSSNPSRPLGLSERCRIVLWSAIRSSPPGSVCQAAI
jgi:hypothetical protein